MEGRYYIEPARERTDRIAQAVTGLGKVCFYPKCAEHAGSSPDARGRHPGRRAAGSRAMWAALQYLQSPSSVTALSWDPVGSMGSGQRVQRLPGRPVAGRDAVLRYFYRRCPEAFPTGSEDEVYREIRSTEFSPLGTIAFRISIYLVAYTGKSSTDHSRTYACSSTRASVAMSEP